MFYERLDKKVQYHGTNTVVKSKVSTTMMKTKMKLSAQAPIKKGSGICGKHTLRCIQSTHS